MKKKSLRFVFTFCILICLTSFAPLQNLERIYAKMESRQLQNGKTIKIKSELCYDQSGSMTSHFTSPAEYVVLTNKAGEIKVYDPTKNTVIVKQGNAFSSQTSQLYFFLSGKFADMGLGDLGFVPVKTYPDKALIVSEWQRKVVDLKSNVQKVKLVHLQQKPIYMDYVDKNGKTIRKVYYYNYTTLSKYNFPAVTTEIIFNSSSDSVITKTVYSDFKINAEANSPYFEFKVPANAQKITSE